MTKKQFKAYVRGLLRTSLTSRDQVQKLIAIRTIASMALAQQFQAA